MKITTDWLSEFTPLTRSVRELAEKLTMAGLEVDSVEAIDLSLTQVIAAKIITAIPHPNASKLQVCDVDAGPLGRHQIVCGAPNARAGLVSFLALPGATIAEERRIEQSEVRGVMSAGMLCSAAELGLGDDSDGLLELPATSQLGAPAGILIALKDTALELNITPNRGDCLSILGVAREAAIIQGQPLPLAVIDSVAPTSAAIFPVELLAGNSCSRYVGRVIEAVDATTNTPLWMKERLRRCGVRSINIIVDITNYTMLALGQPMHAFDLARLQVGIKVRSAVAGESLLMLDGNTLALDEHCLVIADHAHPVALAGVMGGRNTGVEHATKSVFLESALFDPIQLAGVARRFKLHTDAAHRFERGVDPNGQARAIEYATRLILDLCGGNPGPTITAESPTALRAVPPISFRPARVKKILGCELPEAKMCRIFQSIGADVVAEGVSRWQVTPPTFRTDIKYEEDLLEELARINGYDALPTTMPRAPLSMAPSDNKSLLSSLARDVLVAAGYFEAITYSFVSEQAWRWFAQDGLEPIALSNPIAADMSVMRSTLWPGLVLAARHNRNRQISAVRLFEVGQIFERQGEQTSQRMRIGGIAWGENVPEQWDIKARETDFFDVKAELMNLFVAVGAGNEVTFRRAEHPALHPGASTQLVRDDRPIGWLGILHPRLSKYMEVIGNPVLFEIELEALQRTGEPRFSPLSKFPMVRRDISIVVNESLPVEAALDVTWEFAGPLLRDLQLFDVYRGQGIDSDKKSLALGLHFQAPSSTLTDDQIDVVVHSIVEGLRQRVGGILRT